MIFPPPHKRFFHRLFSATFTLKQRWQWRFTRAGKCLQVALLIAAIIGINTRQAVAYQITGLLFSLLAIALITTFISARKLKTPLRLQRQLPRYATVGVPFSYRLTVNPPASNNEPNRPLQDLFLFEINHDPRPDLMQFCTAHEPGAAQRNWFDRRVGFYLWSWLVRLNSVVNIPEISVPPLAAALSPLPSTLTLTHQCTPHSRGVISLDGIALARRDPFGLCRAYHIQPLPGNVLVLPRTYRLPALNLPGSMHNQPEHRVSSTHNGDGEDIAGVRAYRPGDALRDIHWKSFARQGVPMVKEYQAEFAERHALLLDTSGAPPGAAFEEAVALAASLVGDIGQGECLLDLLFVGSELHCFTMGPGELQAEALLRVLAGVCARPGEPLQAVLANIANRRAELCGCVCILLAWDNERQQLIAQLRQQGLPLLVWLVAQQRPVDCPAWLTHLVPGQIEAGLAQL